MKAILILFFCFITTNMQAQNFNGGIILGLSTSQVSGDKLGGFNKAGILAGGFANTHLLSFLSLQMEITYIQKGSNNPSMNENLIPDISLSYISVPIFLKYHQNSNIQIESGLETAVLLSSQDNDFYGTVPKDQSIEFNKYDLSALIGIYYKLSEKITLNSRLSNSILPIREHASGVTFQSNKGQYNSVLSFALHYTI